MTGMEHAIEKAAREAAHLPRDLVAEAKERGKWAHMGRVNSMRRYDYARGIGCDSADGTYLTFGPTVNLPKVLKWIDPNRWSAK